MDKQIYYSKLDALKFLCCIGVVTIHTRPFIEWPEIDRYWSNLVCLCVPLFFICSSFLFWKKILQSKDKEQSVLLIKFVKRLTILYLVWSIIMLPDWFPGYVKHNPSYAWLYLLPAKILLGAPHGSWFVTSLIYSTVICYYGNKYMSKLFVTVLFAILYFTPQIMEYYDIQTSFGIFKLSFSPLKGLLPLQIGYLISSGKCKVFSWGGG